MHFIGRSRDSIFRHISTTAQGRCPFFLHTTAVCPAGGASVEGDISSHSCPNWVLDRRNEFGSLLTHTHRTPLAAGSSTRNRMRHGSATLLFVNPWTWARAPTQGDEKHLLSSNRSPWKHRPPLCHPESSRGICSSTGLSWKCISEDGVWTSRPVGPTANVSPARQEGQLSIDSPTLSDAVGAGTFSPQPASVLRRKTFPGKVRGPADPSAALGMTKRRASLPWRAVTGQKVFFISLGGPQAACGHLPRDDKG